MLLDMHRALPGATVFVVPATLATDQGTCQPGYSSNVGNVGLLTLVIFS